VRGRGHHRRREHPEFLLEVNLILKRVHNEFLWKHLKHCHYSRKQS
jgi:hypothetical protein